MARVSFDRSLCGNLPEALKHEWLETNGLGGFASARTFLTSFLERPTRFAISRLP